MVWDLKALRHDYKLIVMTLLVNPVNKFTIIGMWHNKTGMMLSVAVIISWEGKHENSWEGITERI